MAPAEIATAEVVSVEVEVIEALFSASTVMAPLASAPPTDDGWTLERKAVAARLMRFDAMTPPTAAEFALPLATLDAWDTLVTVATTTPLTSALTISAPATAMVELVILATTLVEATGAVGSDGAGSVQPVPSRVSKVADAMLPPLVSCQPIAFSATVPSMATELPVPAAMVLVSARVVTLDVSAASTRTSLEPPVVVMVELSIEDEIVPVTLVAASMPAPEAEVFAVVVASTVETVSASIVTLSTTSTRTMPAEVTVDPVMMATVDLLSLMNEVVRAMSTVVPVTFGDALVLS